LAPRFQRRAGWVEVWASRRLAGGPRRDRIEKDRRFGDEEGKAAPPPDRWTGLALSPNLWPGRVSPGECRGEAASAA